MIADIKNIVKLMELSKKKAELEFLNRYFSKPFSQSDYDSIISQIQSISDLLKSQKIVFVLPRQSLINSLSAQIDQIPSSELSKQILSKSGSGFDLFCKKGEIVKSNFANRYEIAKLSLLISKLDSSISAKITEHVFSSSSNESFDFSCDDSVLFSLLIILKKLGLTPNLSNAQTIEKLSGVSFVCDYIGYRNYFFSPEQSLRFKEIEIEIQKLMPSIQLKNAEAQIKKFNEEEQKAFEEIQGQYLRLIHEKEAILLAADAI